MCSRRSSDNLSVCVNFGLPAPVQCIVTGADLFNFLFSYFLYLVVVAAAMLIALTCTANGLLSAASAATETVQFCSLGHQRE